MSANLVLPEDLAALEQLEHNLAAMLEQVQALLCGLCYRQAGGFHSGDEVEVTTGGDCGRWGVIQGPRGELFWNVILPKVGGERVDQHVHRKWSSLRKIGRRTKKEPVQAAEEIHS